MLTVLPVLPVQQLLAMPRVPPIQRSANRGSTEGAGGRGEAFRIIGKLIKQLFNCRSFVFFGMMLALQLYPIGLGGI